MTAFALITGGFLVKAAIVPFHFWLADAYTVAPTPAAIVFTGVMSDLGIYAVARIYLTVFQAPLEPHAEGLRAVLIGFAVVTALLGALLALVQNHLKRLLAFVTISQIGLALIGVGLLTPEGVAGAALLIPADGLLRAGLFVCLGAVLHRCGSVYQSYLHGRGRVLPRAFPIFFGAAVLGLAALPPLGAYPGQGARGGGGRRRRLRLGRRSCSWSRPWSPPPRCCAPAPACSTAGARRTRPTPTRASRPPRRAS